MKPIRLAGTMTLYSKKAMHHEKKMTPMWGQWVLMPVCWSLRWARKSCALVWWVMGELSYKVFLAFGDEERAGGGGDDFAAVEVVGGLCSGKGTVGESGLPLSRASVRR